MSLIYVIVLLFDVVDLLLIVPSIHRVKNFATSAVTLLKPGVLANSAAPPEDHH
jgi:hypothetical protein